MAEIINVLQDGSDIAKIHTVMKAPSRRIYGKVAITYTDPMLDSGVDSIDASPEAYNSALMQLLDNDTEVDNLYFTLYSNDLTGTYHPTSIDNQVGWTSDIVSDANGYLSGTPFILIKFPPKPLFRFTIYFDDSHGSVAENFDVTFTNSQGVSETVSITDNKDAIVVLLQDRAFIEAVSVRIDFYKVTKGGHPVVVLDIPTFSTVTYVGYQDESNLISMHLLEELTYEDEVEALGGVSANEIVVVLDNVNKDFNFNNQLSPVAKQLQRNRKIEPWLGTKVDGDEIEWYKLGTFWSYSWDVPFNSLTASVTGFDTIGLLGTTSFTNHQVLKDKSLGELIDYVLTDAKLLLDFLEWNVADELYDEIIPYAWFANGSHAAALRKISEAYPMHIYCDRQGRIVAAPQKLNFDTYVDVWSDDTNVIEKTYSSLYTVLPNLINVSVVTPRVMLDELVNDSFEFDVVDTPTRILNFNKPYLSDITVTVDKDSTVSYTYKAYSWGIEFSFTGTGEVRSIVCNGNALDLSTTSIITRRDDMSIKSNGAITRDIASDFIQTKALANYLTTRLFELSSNDIYDVDVTYRGDIALTINDPILLLDGIAPNNSYNIKRHELTWDGGLSGSATLNT